MGEKDYAIYVIDNLGRASAANALKITDTINKNNYNLKIFMDGLVEHAKSKFDSNKLDEVSMCKVIVAVDTASTKFSSGHSYNKMMLLDNLILDLWEIFS
jgi:hypothetical protein